MADWKQITARIRRARTGKDPVGQLTNLYEKTRDAMVAFELARYFETAGQNPDAAKWYLAAAERFRRADWKTKAQEAAVRLGAEVAAVDPAHSSGDAMLPPPPVTGLDPAPSSDEISAESQSSFAAAESVPPQNPLIRQRKNAVVAVVEVAAIAARAKLRRVLPQAPHPDLWNPQPQRKVFPQGSMTNQPIPNLRGPRILAPSPHSLSNR